MQGVNDLNWCQSSTSQLWCSRSNYILMKVDTRSDILLRSSVAPPLCFLEINRIMGTVTCPTLRNSNMIYTFVSLLRYQLAHAFLVRLLVGLVKCLRYRKTAKPTPSDGCWRSLLVAVDTTPHSSPSKRRWRPFPNEGKLFPALAL